MKNKEPVLSDACSIYCVGVFFLPKGSLALYNIIYRSFKIFNLKTATYRFTEFPLLWLSWLVQTKGFLCTLSSFWARCSPPLMHTCERQEGQASECCQAVCLLTLLLEGFGEFLRKEERGSSNLLFDFIVIGVFWFSSFYQSKKVL